MLNYGSSITSAFPNTFCTSPSALVCQLCNTNINETGYQTAFVKQTTSSASLFASHHTQVGKLEKCTHCGINICSKCLNENHESSPYLNSSGNNKKNIHEEQDIAANASNNSNEIVDDNGYTIHSYTIRNNNNNYNGPIASRNQHSTQAQAHYNTVKKEFKQMYNFSKEIVEKLHLLNNAIKIEESAISELNLIKHKVNIRALELIKQINQEKLELIEQIENVKRKYESTLNDRKEYFALSMQYKDELRKIIRKYKDHKSEENCSLNDLLKMYFSVKNISKKLDDYNHIKLVTEQDPLQVDFDEKPVYRNLIGKLLLNSNSALDDDTADEDTGDEQQQQQHHRLHSKQHNQYQSAIQGKAAPMSSNIKHNQNQHHHRRNKENAQQRHSSKNNLLTSSKDMSRSLSLNDLIDDRNYVTASANQGKERPTAITLIQQNKTKVNSTQQHTPPPPPPPPPPPQPISSNKNSKPISSTKAVTAATASGSSQNLLQQQHPPQPVSILKNSSNQTWSGSNHQSPNAAAGAAATALLDFYRSKRVPKQRLEIDILPSHLCCAKNRLLIASSHGKIRVVDLFSYRIQKDELKNLLISGICMPKSTNHRVMPMLPKATENASSSTSSSSGDCILYAVTNGEVLDRQDYLNVSNSTIIVTRNELKVLKKESTPAASQTWSAAASSSNDDYLFLKPSGICFDEYANLYICDTGYNRVKVLNASLGLSRLIEWGAGAHDRLSQPRSVCVQNSILYICDSGNHRIVTYYVQSGGGDQSSSFEFKFRSVYGLNGGGGGGGCCGEPPGMLSFPLECAADLNSVLAVRDHHNSRVQLFAPDGQAFHAIEVNAQRESIYSMCVCAETADIFVAKMVSGGSDEVQLKRNGVDEDEAYDKETTGNKYYIDIY